MVPSLTFQAVEGGREGLNRIKLPAGFGDSEIGQLERYYRARIAEGYLKWELDLTQIEQFNSVMMGLLVGFDSSLAIRGGSLRVIVIKNSQLAQLLKVAKLDRIIRIVEL